MGRGLSSGGCGWQLPLRICCTASLPVWAAVKPCSDTTDGSAPRPSSSLQVWMCPARAARCSAVWPKVSTAFTCRGQNQGRGLGLGPNPNPNPNPGPNQQVYYRFWSIWTYQIFRPHANMRTHALTHTLAPCLCSTSRTSLCARSAATCSGVMKLWGYGQDSASGE